LLKLFALNETLKSFDYLILNYKKWQGFHFNVIGLFEKVLVVQNFKNDLKIGFISFDLSSFEKGC